MTVWVVRAGKDGEREEAALEQGLCFIGWGELPDLLQFNSKDQIRDTLNDVNSNRKPSTNNNHAGQIWNFLSSIHEGDIIALPLKNIPAIAFGKAVGGYTYKENNPFEMRHCRNVKWNKEPILRADIDPDLRFSFGAIQTVFSVKRNDAENRINTMLSRPKNKDIVKSYGDAEATDPVPNLLDTAAEQISDYIRRNFKGRKLEVLVEAILKAKGYETNLCPEGSDGGVDILAGRGVMGFDNPKLCVQVKSGDSPEGRETLDQLQGNIQKFKAEHGLLYHGGDSSQL